MSIPSNTQDSPDATNAPAPNNRRRSRVLAVAISTVGAVGAWLIIAPIAGVELAVDSWDGGGTMTVSLAHVIVTALIAALAGWASLAALERLTRRARTVWTIGAAVVLLLSLTTPLTATATTAAAVGLAALHLVVGAILIPTLARSAR